MADLCKKVGLSETCEIVLHFLQIYGFQKSAECFKTESSALRDGVVCQKGKQVRNLVEVLNHFLVLTLQSQVKNEAAAISEKLAFLCQNYSKFEYDAGKIAPPAEGSARPPKPSGSPEPRQPRKSVPRKRPLRKKALSEKMALVDKMVEDTDFAAGLADAINTASNGEELQNIDFDSLSFSRGFYEP